MALLRYSEQFVIKTKQHCLIDPPQLQGLIIVGLHPKRVNLGLRRSSLITSEDSLWKWIRDFNLPWVAFGQSVSLSKTTKLILLESLLQEVCIINKKINVLISNLFNAECSFWSNILLELGCGKNKNALSLVDKKNPRTGSRNKEDLREWKNLNNSSRHLWLS